MKSKIILTLFCFIALVSCLPDSTDIKNTEVLNKDEYLDFSTYINKKLSLDYDVDDYIVDFSVYLEDPINHTPTRENSTYLKSGVYPILAAFTSKSGVYEGVVVLPSFIDTVYIVCNSLGMSPCAVVPVVGNEVNYSVSSISSIVSTKAESDYDIGTNIFKWIDGSSSKGSVYALFDYFRLLTTVEKEKENFRSSLVSNTKVPNLYRPITSNKMIIAKEETYSGFSSRLFNTYKYSGTTATALASTLANEALASGNLDTYYTINVQGDKPVNIDVTFYPHGIFTSSIAYYFYPSSQQLTASEIKKLPKYIVFPNTNANVNSKIMARLQYITTDANGDLRGTGQFPSGYRIGFMEISSYGMKGLSDNAVDCYQAMITAATSNYNSEQLSYTNITNTIGGKTIFSSLPMTDAVTGGLFFGFEDKVALGHSDGTDYSDPVIFVTCNDASAIANPKLPIMSDEKLIYPENVTQTSRSESVLLYEDKWPSKGDYDMNDAIIKAETEVVVNGSNKVVSITDKFTPLSVDASFQNAFGYAFDDGGVVDMTKSSNEIIKEADNQYIMISDLNGSVGKTFTLVRSLSDLSISNYQKNYNPFLAIKYQKAVTKRKEVHLPKHEMTFMGDASLTNTEDDRFFIDKSGNYPFSIELNGINSFVPCDNGQNIGSTGNYPFYNGWVEDNTNNTDWYLYKNGY